MAANKIPGVRAAVIRTAEDAEMSRRHNDANVACFGGRVTAIAEAERTLGIFLDIFNVFLFFLQIFGGGGR